MHLKENGRSLMNSIFKTNTYKEHSMFILEESLHLLFLEEFTKKDSLVENMIEMERDSE